MEERARSELTKLAQVYGLDVSGQGAKIMRTSSRFCFGVEHGDYNGTELFGVGTDRFIWMAFKPNGTNKIRLASYNFPSDGLVEFEIGQVPPPLSVKESWARFPYGVDFIARKYGYNLTQGYDGAIFGNIPGGGMSRSASLTINLLLSFFDVNSVVIESDSASQMKIIDMTQGVETEYIGSPCGQLDQIMIYFARAGFGTHFKPATREISYVPLGASACDFAIVGLDTGTVRPGLEKSTYKVRRSECDTLAEVAGKEFGFSKLADVKDEALLQKIQTRFGLDMPGHVKRLEYIFHAQRRFYEMLEAWKAGDIETVGRIFRADGHGLRDEYSISGRELETMCDIARTVPGCLGERMLGGGDKGAAGALVRAEAVEQLRQAVETAYPRAHPAFAAAFAVHVCKVVDGVQVQAGL